MHGLARDREFGVLGIVLGRLDREYLTTLREYKGLQAYPSRTKDPDPVDFSTGSVEFNALSLKIRIQDGEWTTASSSETVKIGANNAEVLVLAVTFGPATAKELAERLAKSQPIRYTLSGSVRSLDPGRNNTLDYQGRLNPTPGLDGVFR